MKKEDYKTAEKLEGEINAMKSALSLIKFTHGQKYAPEFIIQGMTNNTRIQNEELNKKLELIVVEFATVEIIKLQKMFDEL